MAKRDETLPLFELADRKGCDVTQSTIRDPTDQPGWEPHQAAPRLATAKRVDIWRRFRTDLRCRENRTSGLCENCATEKHHLFCRV